jgi:hypothetical protein
MYLATVKHGASERFQIRQSYQDAATGAFVHREVFDLGENPREYLEFMGDSVVFFSNELEHAVANHSSADPDLLLEKLLWNFLPREMRERLSRFDRSDHIIPKPFNENDRAAIQKQIHIFDRRRIYYLYYGAIDQSKLFSMRETVFRPLLGQSRDEREFHFAALEKTLSPDEYRNYLYAIFNLQRHFRASFATFLPEALPEDEVADFFLDEICNLNGSASFWRDNLPHTTLHSHLVRYLLMFFDFIPRNRNFADEFIRHFMNSHRTFRWPERTEKLSEEQISELFGSSLSELKKMSPKELSRLYRKKAMEHHPDQGGDHDRFVELTEVYSSLLRKNPKRNEK